MTYMNALKLMGSMQVNIREYLGWSKPNIAGWKMGAPDGVDVFGYSSQLC